MIGIYEKKGAQLLAHIVESIEEASIWIGCTRRALYYSLHTEGRMQFGKYFIERIGEER